MQVLITDYQSADTALELRLLAEAGLQGASAQCRTAEEVIDAARGADALIASYAPVTAAVIAALPRIKMVSSVGVGVDHIDVEAARQRGVWVANVPDANVIEVATHALGMALTLVRQIAFLDRSVREGAWDYAATGPLRRPANLTLGILGLGRIGRLLAELAGPSFGQILGHDPLLPDAAWPQGVARRDLAALFRDSDVLSLHFPMTDQNRNLVDGRLLGTMRPGSYLVNLARGGLVDLDALLSHLDSGQLAGAALDVLPQEPPPPDHPVLRHPRVVLNPHAAFYSLESEEESRRKSVANIITWFKEGRPTNVVVAGRG